MLVCTLLGAATATAVTAEWVAAARAALADAGARVEASVWLSHGVACDIPFQGVAAPQAEAVLRAALAGAPLDIAVQPAEGRRKDVLVADMDSTIVTSETLDEMAEVLGLKDRIAAITARAMNGELDFALALRERVGLLTGLAEDAIRATLDKVALTPGARTLVATMRAHGAYTVLVSGGFTIIAEPIGARCGFDAVVANRLIFEGGVLNGTVAEPILDKTVKLSVLQDAAKGRGVASDAVCAVGDGANDLLMLQAAGLGVAYHAKPAVRAAAPVRVEHGDLTSLLYLQGFADTALLS